MGRGDAVRREKLKTYSVQQLGDGKVVATSGSPGMVMRTFRDARSIVLFCLEELAEGNTIKVRGSIPIDALRRAQLVIEGVTE